MQRTTYVELESTRLNPHIDPTLHVWGWEVPVYLFLGGLAAGLLILGALAVLTRRHAERPAAMSWMPLLVVPLLMAGLGALFLDLEYKVHVWRFYTTFQVTSPNTNITWPVGVSQNVTWNVAGTDLSPISCSSTRAARASSTPGSSPAPSSTRPMASPTRSRIL